MANYDNRLGEWFKQVERSAQELKKKRTDDVPAEEPKSFVEAEPITSMPRAEVIERAAQEAPAKERIKSSVATIDITDDGVVGEARVQVETPQKAQEPLTAAHKPSPGLFDDVEIPPVEDFFSFLSHKSEPDAEKQDIETATSGYEPIAQSRRVIGIEGTGEPRPIESDSAVQSRVERSEHITYRETLIAQSAINEPASIQDSSLQENWDRMPHHLQTLFGIAGEEVAQNSYKAFKESRGDLIQRLLDPPLTLEEAARILNVCPTTVRRYTNRGVLAHFRTAGNQRRFRLSDVLSFMENGDRAIQDAE